MSDKSFRLMSTDDLCTIIDAVSDTPQDGKWIVTISNKKEKRSVRQLRLYWLLINTIVASGRGGHNEANKERLDLKIKFKLVFPIMVAEDDRLANSWLIHHREMTSDEDSMWWVKQNIHIGDLSTKLMAEVLSQIYREYERDIDLPRPEEQALLNN